MYEFHLPLTGMDLAYSEDERRKDILFDLWHISLLHFLMPFPNVLLNSYLM